MGKRWHDNGMVYFRSADLMAYLDKKKFREFKPRQIWPILRAQGAKHQQVHTKGKCVQCWFLPEPEEQTEDHTVPERVDIDEGEEF